MQNWLLKRASQKSEKATMVQCGPALSRQMANCTLRRPKMATSNCGSSRVDHSDCGHEDQDCTFCATCRRPADEFSRPASKNARHSDKPLRSNQARNQALRQTDEMIEPPREHSAPQSSELVDGIHGIRCAASLQRGRFQSQMLCLQNDCTGQATACIPNAHQAAQFEALVAGTDGMPLKYGIHHSEITQAHATLALSLRSAQLLQNQLRHLNSRSLCLRRAHLRLSSITSRASVPKPERVADVLTQTSLAHHACTTKNTRVAVAVLTPRLHSE